MRPSVPVLLIASGLVLIVAGFVYDVALAGIPYPDPTPTMADDYAHHARVASMIGWAGVAVALSGFVAAVVRRRAERPRTRPGGRP